MSSGGIIPKPDCIVRRRNVTAPAIDLRASLNNEATVAPES